MVILASLRPASSLNQIRGSSGIPKPDSAKPDHALAREKGISAFVGDGLNRSPAVHRLDAAHLFRPALEKGSAGARYHGVAEEGVPLRDIADVIGRRLNVPVVTKSPKEAAGHFSWLAPFLSVDNPASSRRTRELLGWQPKEPGVIPDIDRYFET